MKKFIISTVVAICFCFVCFAACNNNSILAKPENTTLEFWIAEKVSADDFNDHEQILGMFGGDLYFGKGYHANEINEDGVVYPEHYVTYTVTAYPDYSSNGGRYDTVTRIEITDTNVSVGGISCDSSLEEFDAVFKGLGCNIQDKGIIHIATFGNASISFADYDENEIITIWVNVTNKQGIVF